MTGVQCEMRITGLVQGVGFRPFVFRLAAVHSLGGWVRNDTQGVTILVEGRPQSIDGFTVDLRSRLPDLARIDSVTITSRTVIDTWSDCFRIRQSELEGSAGALVPPDSHVCRDCQREMFDPNDRRYGYPLSNCTNCGPRFSIVARLPYDRPFTTMRAFAMCRLCRAEYENPADRRFHAQPISCWNCGPQVQLLDQAGSRIDVADPVRAAVEELLAGRVVAVKAIGGYQIVADPSVPGAVRALRQRKERSLKPFALIATDCDIVSRHTYIDAAERRLLESPARPIVLLRRHPDAPAWAEDVAPGSRTLGFMLPTTPLQYLLLAHTDHVLIATSGNAPDEPMARTEDEALAQLGPIVDTFLVHNREIHQRVDDSIARVVQGPSGTVTTIIRRARGYTPLPVRLPVPVDPVLALGPELKNTVSLGEAHVLHLGQHIGDLKTTGNQDFFGESIRHLRAISRIQPKIIAHDLHPDFYSTRYAATCARVDREVRTVAVQHHHAHMAACMVDNGLTGPVVGVIFDGTGYGLDGTIWGGEFLVGDYRGFERRGHLGSFRLPGGDQAVREPWRVGLSLLVQHLGGEVNDLPLSVLGDRDPFEIDVLVKMIDRGIHSPETSSMGRLFDGISALLGVCDTVGYEAQAAIELEQIIAPDATSDESWPLVVTRKDGKLVIDHAPWIRALMDDLLNRRLPPAVISRRFHESVASAAARVAAHVCRETGVRDVVLSGGVFLNQHLLVRVQERMTAAGDGLRVYTHHAIPTTDGGVSVGQAMVAGIRPEMSDVDEERSSPT